MQIAAGFTLFRHRVEASGMEWMALAYPFDSQPTTLQGAMLLKSFESIIRATWVESA
jgi:hypothetical protein